MERYPYLKPYLTRLHGNGVARSTLYVHEKEVKRWWDWCLTATGFCDPKKIKKKDFISYRDYLQENNFRHASLQQFFNVLRSYFGFLANELVLENSPFPASLRFRGQESTPTLVPTPLQLFRVRLQPNVELRAAFYMELLLSTGMRREEASQLRASDINFEDKPFDKELQRPSPYFAGSINLLTSKFNLKTRKPRKVFFSTLAGNLYKRYIALYSIEHGSNTPLCPWDPVNIGLWLKTVGAGIIGDNVGTNTEGLGREQHRERGFTDIDPDTLRVSEAFKKRLRKRQAFERELPPQQRQASQPIKDRRRFFHPHCLRHCFTNFMYYRNCFGERNAEDHLRILLGHQSSQTTYIYLRDLDLIQNDDQWKRLFLGKPDDWSGIMEG